MGTFLAFAGIAVMVLAMAAAMVGDVATFRIPNVLPVLSALAFLPAALGSGLPAIDLLWHAVTGAAVLCIGFLLFMRGFIGGGDAKLLAAGALWTGASELYAFLFFVALIGGAFALLLILFRRFPLPPSMARIGWLDALYHNRAHIPYGVAIGSGMMCVIWRMPITAPFLDALGPIG